MRALYYLPALALLAGCATTGPKTPGDPYEGFNRKMWGFDRTLDKAVMKPVAKGYITVMPSPLRHGLSNMASNVSEPFSFINAVLQAKPKRALNIMGRFVINTTIGIGGFRDVASKVGYPQMPEDLGQTFAVWGAKKSTYLVLPFYGPSTVRDGIGTIASEWVDPYKIVIRKELSFWPAAAVTGFEFVDARANLIDAGADTLLDTSADPYAVARSAYLQHRQALIENRDDSDAGTGNDDAALNAALDELGPEGNAGAAAPAQPAAPAPANGASNPASTPTQPEQSAPATPQPQSDSNTPK
jgi:phospholipid-binding lipoprotein MlaA